MNDTAQPSLRARSDFPFDSGSLGFSLVALFIRSSFASIVVDFFFFLRARLFDIF